MEPDAETRAKHQAEPGSLVEEWWIDVSKPEGSRTIQADTQSTNLGSWVLTEPGPPSREHAALGPRPRTHLQQNTSLVFM